MEMLFKTNIGLSLHWWERFKKFLIGKKPFQEWSSVSVIGPFTMTYDRAMLWGKWTVTKLDIDLVACEVNEDGKINIRV